MKSLWLSVILLFQGAAFAQTQTGVVTGVLHGADGAPLAGVRIAAVDVSKSADRRTIDSDFMSIAQTDRAGAYRLENIPSGKYYIVADPIGNPAFYPGTADISAATAISVTAGATVRAGDFVFAPWSNILKSVRHSGLDQAGRFFGRVGAANGVPLQNATLALSDANGNILFMTVTNRDGAFEFTDLPQAPLSLDILSAVETGYNAQGYEQLKTSIALQPRESLELIIRLRMLVSAALARSRPDIYTAPPSPRRDPSSPRVVSVGGLGNRAGVQDRISRPAGAGAAAAEESVVLWGAVGVDGRLTALRVVKPDANPDLVRAAIEAVRHWSFPAATVGGEPVIQNGNITATFAPSN